MKKYIYIIYSLLAVTVLSFSSCLKDDRMILDPDKGHNVVEFANPAERAEVGSVYTLYPMLVDIAPEIEFPITFSYSGPEAEAPQDIVINFAVGDEGVITAYNDEQGTEFSMLPTDYFTFSSMQATIKKGESKATVMVKFNSTSFDFVTLYALPLTITDVSYGIISGNYGTIILNPGPKNPYHGSYFYTYTTSDANLGSNTIGVNTTLTTVDANTVKPPYFIDTYTNAIEYYIDPDTYQVTVWMDTLLPIATDPSSHWDPDTKTLYIKWTSNGGGRLFEETYVMNQ